MSAVTGSNNSDHGGHRHFALPFRPKQSRRATFDRARANTSTIAATGDNIVPIARGVVRLQRNENGMAFWG